MYTDEFLARLRAAVRHRLVGRGLGDVPRRRQHLSRTSAPTGSATAPSTSPSSRAPTAATRRPPWQLNRRPADDRFYRLTVNASYTWSRLTGNWDIDFAPGDSPFYNSSFIGDGPGVLITDNRNGILRGDRTHVAKLFAVIRPADAWTHRHLHLLPERRRLGGPGPPRPERLEQLLHPLSGEGGLAADAGLVRRRPAHLL